MLTLNLGILAHVDAGKTTLTERLLYASGVIDEVGSVDKGTTQTDSLALEQQRGITIKSAVVSFALAGVTVNLIDTPGHPDFIAEVERVLDVLDGAVLVVSAVEGVQAQTPLLMRALQRERVRLCRAIVDTADLVDRSGREEEPLCECCLTGVYMRQDPQVERSSKQASFPPNRSQRPPRLAMTQCAFVAPGRIGAVGESKAEPTS